MGRFSFLIIYNTFLLSHSLQIVHISAVTCLPPEAVVKPIEIIHFRHFLLQLVSSEFKVDNLICVFFFFVANEFILSGQFSGEIENAQEV